jgi:glucosamine kinase
MPFYLAVDAGGTKTQCLLADDNRVLARASTGTIKLMRVSEADATSRLQTMLREVATDAQVSLADVTRTCIGIAGIASQSVRDWAASTISAVVPGELLILGDQEIALDAAFAGGPGILIIAGTGNNCIGRSPAGQLFGAGGWGPVLGDEGSGYWIGLEAIRAALRAQDRLGLGEPPFTCLLRDIERHWNLASTGDLIALANLRAPSANSTPPDFAALAPIVASCASAGDSLAAGVLERAGEELADLVTVVFHKMTSTTPGAPSTTASPPSVGSHNPPSAYSPDIAYTGSVLTHIPAVRAAMAARLALTLPTARILDSPVDSLEGALWRARHA